MTSHREMQIGRFGTERSICRKGLLGCSQVLCVKDVESSTSNIEQSLCVSFPIALECVRSTHPSERRLPQNTALLQMDRQSSEQMRCGRECLVSEPSVIGDEDLGLVPDGPSLGITLEWKGSIGGGIEGENQRAELEEQQAVIHACLLCEGLQASIVFLSKNVGGAGEDGYLDCVDEVRGVVAVEVSILDLTVDDVDGASSVEGLVAGNRSRTDTGGRLHGIVEECCW